MKKMLAVGLMGIVLLICVSGVNGAITNEKDSINFSSKEFEGSPIPTDLNGGDLSTNGDWSVITIDGNDYYNITQDGATGYAGKNDYFSYATGWTFEIRFKVLADAASGPALNITASDGDSDHYYSVNIYGTKIESGYGGQEYAMNLTDCFHVLRIAQEENGGEQKIYLDGEETSFTFSTGSWTLNQQRFGDMSGDTKAGGHIQVDYVRMDNTGAYAATPPSMQQKDSADFSSREFEGSPIPTDLNGGDLSTNGDWSVTTIDGNDYYDINQDGATGYAGTNGYFNYNAGWTFEMRFKVLADAASGPALNVTMSDGVNSHYYIADLYGAKIVSGYGGQAYTVDLTDKFHVLRVAQLGNGGEQKTYLDGEEISFTFTSGDWTDNKQRFGDISGATIAGGHILVDYVRMDNTDAYAPVIPPTGTVIIVK